MKRKQLLFPPSFPILMIFLLTRKASMIGLWHFTTLLLLQATLIMSKIPVHNGNYPTPSPWWSDKLTDLKRNYNRLNRLVKFSPPSFKQLYIASLKDVRSEFRKEIRQAKLNAWRKFCTDENTSPWGKFFRFIKSPICQILQKQ